MSKPQPPRLGRGLASLIPTNDKTLRTSTDPITQQPPTDRQVLHGQDAIQQSRITALMIPVGNIRANPRQPRKSFDETALESLAKSLKERGTIQPIVVRQAGAGYELIAGERRLRAALIAGMIEIPAIVRPAGDDDMLDLALIENIHREDLNPIERAKAYQSLATKHHLSHDQIAERMNEDRATVSNYLRLLNLQDDVSVMVAIGVLSMGHAKALLAISDKQSQKSIADQIVRGGWSVRQAEMFISKSHDQNPARKTADRRPAVQDLEKLLETSLGTRVVIHEGRRKHTGRITIEYYNLDDFQRIVGRLGLGAEPA